MDQLEGKTAIVTGAASGIGNALARRFAHLGMQVVLADVEDEPLERAVEDIRRSGASALGVLVDVRHHEQVDELARRTIDTFGAAHVVCNNAGVVVRGNVWQLTLEDWQWVIDVDLWGVVHGVRAFLPLLMDQGEGHIVNTASMSGLRSTPNDAPYRVAKHGVVALSETLQLELAQVGSEVGVSVLCPGPVNTQIRDAERNRPTGQRPTVTPGSGRGPDMSGEMDPDDVATMVVAAIRERRFWIFTHPDEVRSLRAGFEAMLANT